ncbi:MAG: Gfo/Idh/MocA family oxidoreductase [Clostridia bacterium]|nr:Gfo/Idh/MocA family oxidoreductase [Clostridia bacterium]
MNGFRKYKVGIIGCGAISNHYLRFAQSAYSDWFEITSLGDIVVEKAAERAEKYGIKKFGDPETVYNDPEVDLIINLTVPKVHEEVSVHALEAGKHVYSEKPFATSREGMRHIMEVAAKRSLRAGCAPDSFLSAPAQTAKKALEDDWIGEPVGVNAICAMRGNEYWRPDSDFFYKKGAGPMMDMAPYYLNIFVSLLGPVESVFAASRMTWDQRTIKVAPRRGEKIDVEVPTYVSTALTFKSGIIATFVNSFDIWATRQPHIEVFGTKGTMVIPDPNQYKGDVLIRRFKDSEWRVFPQFVEYGEYGRGIGVADMVRAIEEKRPHRASAELAYHVTDVILSMEESGEKGEVVKISSSAEKPAGLWLSPEEILWK